MAVSSVGVMELLILIMSGGMFSGGLPFGLPSSGDDPLISHVAPQSCFVYVAWNGMAKPSADSKNLTEQFLANDEIQQFADDVTSRLLKSLRKQTAEEEIPRVLAAEIPGVLKVLATRPTALYVGKPDPLPTIGLLCRVGDNAQDVENAIKRIQDAVADEPGTVVERDGLKIHQWPVAPQGPPLEWGIVDDCLVIGFGPGEFQNIVERKKAEKTPVWLSTVQKRLSVERPGNIVHFNTEAMLESAAPVLQGQPHVLKILNALGLNDVRSISTVTGLDGTGCVSKTWINSVGPARGILKLAKVDPVSEQDLNAVPADSRVAVAFRMDAASVFSQITEIAESVEPGSAQHIRENFGFIDSTFGMNLEQDILGSLGDSWRIYQSPAEGGSLYTGWTGVVSVRDAEKLRDLTNVLKGFYAAQSAHLNTGPRSSRRARQVQLQSVKAGDNEIYFLNFIREESPFAPAWCLSDDELIVSVFPQGIKAYLNRKESVPRLSTSDEIADSIDDSVAIVHYDTAEIFNSVYPLIQIGANFMCAELQGEGIDLDISLLPSASSISQYLRPSTLAVKSADDGIEIVSRRTLPIGIESSSSLMPLVLFGIRSPMRMAGPHEVAAVADVLSPMRARLNNSKNNMKMIMLALHNYHDVNRRFPPAVTKTASGKPGLSWRVHLLPYLEQAPLYNQFKLDEPWDSENNKALIRRMPDVFRAPGSKAEPTKTNYVGFRAENTMLPPDGEGIYIADVTDGTSNTIMFVEADDEHAVTWTKPDDLDYDDENPLNGLRSPSTTDTFLVGMTDGSVRVISLMIDPAVLRNLIIRNDGNVIDRF